MLQPLRRRVWAPRGQTPIQYCWDRHDRITAIAALTRAPWAARLGLYYMLLDNAKAQDFVRFLREVHRRLRRPMILVCDRLPAHRTAFRQLVESGANWISIEWLPPYAPDLDPVEDLWNQSKFSDLANVVPDDVDDLRYNLIDTLELYRHETNRLYSFFSAAGLSV